MQIMRPLNESPQRQNAVQDAKKAVNNESTVPQEYVISRILRHVGTSQGGGYELRFYRYGPEADTLQLRH